MREGPAQFLQIQAEEVVFARASHGAGGSAGSDLERATGVAAAMIASSGLAGPRPLLYLGARDQRDELLAHADVRQAVNEELTKGTVVHRFTATDPDSNIDKFRIFPKSKHFSIEPGTGALKVKSRIDYEALDENQKRLMFMKFQLEQIYSFMKNVYLILLLKGSHC